MSLLLLSFISQQLLSSYGFCRGWPKSMLLPAPQVVCHKGSQMSLIRPEHGSGHSSHPEQKLLPLKQPKGPTALQRPLPPNLTSLQSFQLPTEPHTLQSPRTHPRSGPWSSSSHTGGTLCPFSPRCLCSPHPLYSRTLLGEMVERKDYRFDWFLKRCVKLKVELELKISCRLHYMF